MANSQWLKSELGEENICDQDEELWFNDEEDFDEEGSGPVLGPGGLGEPTKASCTSVSTTSPQAAAAATAALPCQEKVEAPSIVKVVFTLAKMGV